MRPALAASSLLVLVLATSTPGRAASSTPTPAPRRTATASPTPRPRPSATPTSTATDFPSPTATSTPTPRQPALQARQLRVGFSARGRPIDAFALGEGPAVLVVGGIHGSPEGNSSQVVWQLLRSFETEPRAVLRQLSLIFVPEANPDGLVEGTRELADGVDPNRNWPTSDWTPDSFGPHGEVIAGGGPEPLSEPETYALATLVIQAQPVAVLSYHSAGGLVMGGRLARASGIWGAYVQATGYTGMDWAFYPVTGDFAQWCEDLRIPTVEVELTDHYNTELERNMAGLESLLQVVQSELGRDQSY